MQPRSLKKGIVANLLNPHPYLFWITVGAPTAIKARQDGVITVILFFAAFYILLTGSKIMVARMTGKTRSFLSGKAYRWIMRLLGIVLLLFSAFFIYDGVQMFSGI